MRGRLLLILASMFVLSAGMGACHGSSPSGTAAPTRAAGSSPAPTGTQPPQEKTYENRTLGIAVAYSADWRGPEVYETESSLTFEVGTDVVYPYGTSREDRVYTKENSYYITLQYNKKPADAALAEYESDQPWMAQYLSLLSLSDGDSVSSPRSVVTRVRSVGVGPFSGAEFISTLPESAQTERFYVREVILINDNYDAIRVAGSPNNVIVQDARNWQADYEAVDRDNLATFRRLVDSISVGSSEENVSGIQPLDGPHKRGRQ